MQLIGLARIGRDAEVRYTQSGKAVCSLSLAFNYGRKGQDGYKPSQWVEGTLWDKQAEALAPYLTKGSQVVVTLDDPHIEEYEGKNGKGHKLTGRVTAIEFAGGGERQARPAAQSAPAPAPASGGGEPFDDDIPF